MKIKISLFALLLMIASFSLFAQESEKYYISKIVDYSFEEATLKVRESLKNQQFGVITEIDMHEKLSEKDPSLKIEPYRILGACNPAFAYETLKVEENIGLFLPCKVLIKQIDEKRSEIVMVNPSVLMKMLGNDDLMSVADEVTKRFKKALEDI